MAQPRKGRRHHPESIANHSNLPLQQEPNGLETELSHTGMKILPSTPPPASLHAPPLSLDQEMNPPKDVDSLFKPKKPSAGHAKEKYPQGPSSISSIIDVESNGTPFKTEMIGLDDADEVMNIVSKGRRRGGGVGRSRGGARGRGVKKGAIEAL